LLLAVFGGLGGVILARWGSSALEAMVSGALPVALDVSPDGRVLAFAAITTCATVLAFGALPALRGTRIDPVDALKASNAAAGGPRRTRLARALVGGQIAVSVVLLVLAGLFVRSLIGLQRIDTGFDPADVILLRVALPARGELTPDLKRSLYRHLLERAENVPGVLGASASFTGVMSSETWRNVIAVEGFAPPAGVTPRSFANAVTGGYFSVMGIAVLRGRGFTDADRETTGRVAVVNDTFARQFFAASNPVGTRVQLCSSESCGAPDAMMTIVGVVEDAKYTDLREPPRPMLYVPFTQATQNLSELQVRTSGDPAAVAATLHRALAAADPRLTIVGMIEARDQVDASLIGERLIARLSATFGLLAAALAAVGLYGLVAYVTVQRTGEIGIRVALGATRSDVRRLVLRDAVTLLAAGLLIGVPIAMAGARLIASQLYEVAPTDALVFGSALATIAGAALVAGYLPARRAVRLDPATALRRE
jgi:predicted permease